MFGIIGSLFVTFFYQPFFNLLVGIYLLLDFALPQYADIGISVIIFTIIFRILWLPMSLASDRSEKEKREIGEQVKKIKQEFRNQQDQQKLEIKKLLGRNKRVVIFSAINISFQLLIILMLYRIFTKGLEGADFHLLYPFMPEITEPLNLIFLGKYDLTRPNFILNLIQTAVLFLAEVLSALFSPFPVSREDFVTVFILPIVSFIFFSAMPAGKKLFIITTLTFSICLMLVKRIIFLYHMLSDKLAGLPAKFQKPAESK